MRSFAEKPRPEGHGYILQRAIALCDTACAVLSFASLCVPGEASAWLDQAGRAVALAGVAFRASRPRAAS